MSQRFLVAFRRLLWFGSSVIWLGGCATMQPTVAQQMAQGAWDACKAEGRISINVAFDRVDSDGRIYWHTPSSAYGSQEAQACLQEKFREAKFAVTSIVSRAAPSGTAATQSAESAPLPVWRPGDEWGFRWQSSRGTGLFVWSVDRVEAVGGAEAYVVRQGQATELYYRVSDLAWILDKEKGAVKRQADPADLRYAWPLTVGKRWESVYKYVRSSDRSSSQLARECEIVARETVTVPAGGFDTFRIDCRNKRTGNLVLECWYAPTVKHWVRWRSHFSYGVEERELMTFRLK